jgi:hypothetical protein
MSEFASDAPNLGYHTPAQMGAGQATVVQDMDILVAHEIAQSAGKPSANSNPHDPWESEGGIMDNSFSGTIFFPSSLRRIRLSASFSAN